MELWQTWTGSPRLWLDQFEPIWQPHMPLSVAPAKPHVDQTTGIPWHCFSEQEAWVRALTKALTISFFLFLKIEHLYEISLISGFQTIKFWSRVFQETTVFLNETSLSPIILFNCCTLCRALWWSISKTISLSEDTDVELRKDTPLGYRN